MITAFVANLLALLFEAGDCAVKVCTYNVRNLFLLDEGSPKLEKELRPLARMIDQVGADVVALQEVGSQSSLDKLNARLVEPYEYCETVVGNSNRSIHLAVMSRRPFNSYSHKDTRLRSVEGAALEYYVSQSDAETQRLSPLGFHRDLLQVEIELEAGRQLALFCVHLKSRTNQPWQVLAADVMRAAECRAVRSIVADYVAGHGANLVCLLGDFNDRITSDALAPLQDLHLHDPLGDLLKRTGRNPSTYWPKRRMRIDHLLVAPNTVAHVRPDSAMIHVSQMARTASDHYPVSIELMLADLSNNESTERA